MNSEQDHDYVSPDASDPAAIISRFEWGPDTAKSPCPSAPKSNPDNYVEFEFEADAGKTWLIKNFKEEDLEGVLSTTFLKTEKCVAEVDGLSISLKVIDTAGKHPALNSVYCVGAHAVVFG